MKLKKLTLRNFKGCRLLELQPDGRNLRIYGDNATGKTTVGDAFFWLLFGKDSAGRKDFGIKTLDVAGKPVPMLDHEVRAELDVNGETLTFQRSYKEIYTKKRGSQASEFSGHTTDYWVNSVPVQAKDFESHVSGLCDESKFRLLTDPNAFNSLKWDARRKLLLEVCGDVTDAEVIAGNPKLAELPAILGRHSLDDYRKILVARRRETNEQIDKIPLLIGELNRGLPAETPVSAEFDSLKSKLDELNAKRSQLLAGGEIAELQKALAANEAQRLDVLNQLTEETAGLHAELIAKLREADRLTTDADLNCNRLKAKIIEQGTRVTELQDRRALLLAQYNAIGAEVFTGDAKCASCGQPLPIEDAEANFNASKASRLEEALSRGRAVRAELDGAIGTLEALKSEAEDAGQALGQASGARTAAHAALQTLDADRKSVIADHPELKTIAAVKAEIEQSIEEVRSGNRLSLLDTEQEISVVGARLDEIRQTIARNEERGRTLARIAELSEEEKTLAGVLAKIDSELHLTEEFVRTKVRRLEERINNKFEIARFKLFEVQINGGLAETCETTFDGVPYSDLNHGARLNVGLDIIDTLAEHYQFAPPIIIDNAESVTSIRPTRGQQIQLIVSESDKSLRVEGTTAQEALRV